MIGRSDGLVEEEEGLTRDKSQGGDVNSYNISTVIFQVWNENIPHDKTNTAGYSKGEVSSTTRKKNAARCYSKWKKGGDEGKECLNQGLHPTINDDSFRRYYQSINNNKISPFLIFLLLVLHLLDLPKYAEGKY